MEKERQEGEEEREEALGEEEKKRKEIRRGK